MFQNCNDFKIKAFLLRPYAWDKDLGILGQDLVQAPSAYRVV